MPQKLYTPAGAALRDDQIPWQAYPRPRMRREDWMNLNGEWDFCVREEDGLPQQYDRTIRVPFPPESLLSGIDAHFPEGSRLCYRRRFSTPAGSGRVLLHIGAADQVADVFVNGSHAGHHEGGYTAMCFDITAFLQEENELVIRVTDDLRRASFPHGKQRVKRGGMWYTPVSGIWQTVWLERVPERYIPGISVRTRRNEVELDTGDETLSGIVTVDTPLGKLTFPLKEGKAVFSLEKPHMWSPENPWLYPCTVEAGEDRVETYFALRDLEIRTVGSYARLCLNGKPYFFHGLLDQGYWSDGLYTPADPESYARDIRTAKGLGFNTLRKHLKVEPEEFYYQCDKLGMVVFQDMVNCGTYRFLTDSALPTLGLQRMPERKADDETQRRFLETMTATVSALGSHPCICCWTIFNEGWGQFDSSGCYDVLRALDNTRLIDTASGWFRGGRTDVDSRHVYFGKILLKAGKKPLILSEFGGLSLRVQGHCYHLKKNYGYGDCQTREELCKTISQLYRRQVIPLARKGLCAAIYTQLSDVEEETNGLVTYDRRWVKVDLEPMLRIAAALGEAVTEE